MMAQRDGMKAWLWRHLHVVAIALLLAGFGGYNLFQRPSDRTYPTPAATTLPEVRIGYQQIALYRHVFTADAKGFFASEGLSVKLEPFVSANQMMEALLAGKIDATALTNLEVAINVQAKDPGRFVLTNMLVWGDNSYPDYLLVRDGVDVRSLKELEGRTVALHPGSAVKAFSATMLKGEDVDLSKIRFLEMKPDTMQAALVAGTIDAVYCMDPVATALVSSGQARVLVSNPMNRIFASPVPISGAAVSTRLVRNELDSAQALVRALDRAIQYLREPAHDEEIAGYIEKFTSIPASLASQMNPSEYWTFAELDPKRVQELSDRFHELGIVSAKLDVGQMLIPSNFLSTNGSEAR